MNTENHGAESEAILHQLTAVRFLRDFVFPNPFYFKGPHKRELVDMLVMVEDTLLLFQIKSHTSKPDSAHNLQRAQRKLNEAFRQFRTLAEAAKSLSGVSLTNLKGIEVPFDIKSFKSIFMICVIDFVQEEEAPPIHFRTTGYNEHDLPIFVIGFEAHDLFFLLHQLDTIPDFTTYLSILAVLETTFPISLKMTFLDLLAYTRLYPEELIAAIESKTPPIHLVPGIAENMMDRLSEFEMEESYIIDDIIEWLHLVIGMPHLEMENPNKFQKLPMNSVQSYWIVVNKLANLPRSNRLVLAQLLQRKEMESQCSDNAFGALLVQNHAYMIHFSNSIQKDRVRELGGLCIALLAENSSIETVTGLTFPSFKNKYLCDVIYIDREWMGDLSKVLREVQKHNIFSTPTTLQIP